jgi:hypothetical protein
MQRKYIALIVIVVTIGTLGLMEYTMGTFSALAFDQIDYSYNSKVTLPPSTPGGSYLGGYYDINGTGRDFNMVLVLSGAEKGESPLDYTSDGLKVKGHIDMVKVTPQTIIYLLQKDLKDAMFNTILTGNMNMTCAAWTGTSQFQNDGKNFNGTFFINGVYTDWDGNYTLTLEDGRLVITADYIYYPKNKPEEAYDLHSVYYL